jgi:EEF1A N-terminal glycine/lysine methyltransferase
MDSPIKATYATPASPTKTIETETKSPTSPAPMISPTVSNTPTTPSITVAPTEDSDTDFQSAYSSSPRESYHSDEAAEHGAGAGAKKNGNKKQVLDDDEELYKAKMQQELALGGGMIDGPHGRDRVSSVATAKASDVYA